MRIAQVNLQHDYGGAERHVLLLARGLAAVGHAVSLICHPDGRLRKEADKLGLSTVPIKTLHQFDPSTTLRLTDWLRQWRPEALHLHTPKDYLCGVRAGRLSRTPTVITRHLILPLKPHMRRLYRRVDAVICLNRTLRAHLIQQGIPAEKLELIYGAIDTEAFHPCTAETRQAARAASGWAEADLLIGVVGRLVKGKGHDRLLSAAALLAAAGVEARFLIVGAGPERDALQAAAAQLGIMDRVCFTGFIADMPQVMAALDILALPSTCEELLPLVVMEGMAAGLPVVATRVGGVPEIVEDGITGLLVSAQDAPALAAALHHLIVDPALRSRLGEAAAQRARQHFSLVRMAADTERLYNRVVSGQ